MLAGGSGTRLRPITYTSAKQLVPLANKPILFYGLEAIAAAGIREVGLVVGDSEQSFRDAVGSGEQFGLEVTYLRQDAPRGLAHAVLIARDFLGDEPFLMYLGDNLVVGGVTDFVDQFQQSSPDALVLLAHVDRPEQFGVAELDPQGRLVSLVEKPKEPKSDLALVGAYLFGPAIHEAVAKIEPSGRNELEITDAIQWLVAHEKVVDSQVLERPFIDTGKLQDLLEANTIVLGAIEGRTDGEVDAESELVGQVIIETGARVVNSRILGPAVIGSGRARRSGRPSAPRCRSDPAAWWSTRRSSTRCCSKVPGSRGSRGSSTASWVATPGSAAPTAPTASCSPTTARSASADRRLRGRRGRRRARRTASGRAGSPGSSRWPCAAWRCCRRSAGRRRCARARGR